MRSVVALVAALTATCLSGCGSWSEGAPAPGAPSQSQAVNAGNDAYNVPASPFTRKNTVVTASCTLGARFAAVSIQAWDPANWDMRAERSFGLPSNAAFGNHPGVQAVHSPLVDLCGGLPGASSPYAANDPESMTARLRSLFDLGFTRLAVVLREPDGTGTRAGFVEADDAQDEGAEVTRQVGGEQNAAMSPDGQSVWFTYADRSGKPRIGSRKIEQGHRLSEVSDEGPSVGHRLPLTITGKPPRAIQAEMVRVSPNGRRITAGAANVFGDIFDAPGASGALTKRSARNATLAGGCLGVVGWLSDTRVLCRTEKRAFQPVDARSGRTAGKPIAAVGADEGLVAEGMLVSPGGEEFIVLAHPPNDSQREAVMPIAPDFRVVPATPGGRPRPISHNYLSLETVFLSWR